MGSHYSLFINLSVGCPDNDLPVLHDDLLVHPGEVGLLEILEPWCLSSNSLPGSSTSFLYSGSGDIICQNSLINLLCILVQVI